MKTSHFKYIGIDPGVGGGIASIDEDGKIKAYKCPGSSEDMALLFEVLIGNTIASFLLISNSLASSPTATAISNQLATPASHQ